MMFIDRIFTLVTSVTKPHLLQEYPLYNTCDTPCRNLRI
nr:MAG TPA: hypothetical protein [Caudoviricetes sp.]DAS35162.1 MAG TPA: hypothetical protein [Caudoviricetes sp.]